MVQFVALPVFLCAMGFISETLCSLTLEAEAGDNVTIWCQHGLTDPGYIFWFKHMNDSVPVRLGCKQFYTSAPSQNCYFFTESERIVMSVHDKNTSLTITAVNVSDTGLYYCNFMKQNQITFSNSSYLRLKDRNKTLSKNLDRAKDYICSSAFFMLNAVFGALIVILLSVLIIIILKHTKTHRGAETEDNEFSKKILKRRHDEVEYSYVVYSSVSQ